MLHYGVEHYARIQRSDDGGVSEGEGCSTDTSGIAEEEEHTIRAAVLGQGILREYCGPERTADSKVCS